MLIHQRVVPMIRRFRRDQSHWMIVLQSFSSIEFSKISVKGTQRYMTGLQSYFENQTIGEPQRGTAAVLLQRCRDSIGFLDCEIFVLQEHIDGSRYFWMSEFVDGRKDPRCLDEDERRYLRTFANEGFRRSDLLAVVTRDKANQHVGINGAHASLSYSAARLFRSLPASSAWGHLSERSLGEYPATSIGRPCEQQSHRPPHPTPESNLARYRVFAAPQRERKFDLEP